MTDDAAPAPFTTIDIDLDGMPGFMLDTEQLRQSELWALSTGEEFKAAVGLWCRAWQQKPPGSLPNDDRVLAAWSGVGRRWNKVRDMALRGFVLCSDDRLYHRVLCQDVLRAWAKRTVFRDRASAAAAARWARDKQSSSNASSMLEPAQGKEKGKEKERIQGAAATSRAAAAAPPDDQDPFQGEAPAVTRALSAETYLDWKGRYRAHLGFQPQRGASDADWSALFNEHGWADMVAAAEFLVGQLKPGHLLWPDQFAKLAKG